MDSFNLCVATEVPLTEISSVQHLLSSVDLFATLIWIAWLQLYILRSFLAPNNSMIVETTRHVWVTINKRVSQIAVPTPIHEKISKRVEDQITDRL